MSNADYQKAIAERFANEAPDLEWQRLTAGQLTDHFYRANPFGEGATLESVECKATLCLVVAKTHERNDEEVIGPRSTLWGGMIAFNIRTVQPTGDGPLEIVAYLAARPTGARQP